MESSCGRYLIVYNGEIYNFRELRERIEKSKVKFKSSTDTEVIIELVSKFGVVKTTKLLNFSIYTTLEPCLMCESLIISVGIKKIYFGAFSDNVKISPSLLIEGNSSQIDPFFLL